MIVFYRKKIVSHQLVRTFNIHRSLLKLLCYYYVLPKFLKKLLYSTENSIFHWSSLIYNHLRKKRRLKKRDDSKPFFFYERNMYIFFLLQICVHCTLQAAESVVISPRLLFVVVNSETTRTANFSLKLPKSIHRV